MVESPLNSDVLGLTAQIVSAHVSNNSVTTDALPSLIQDVYRTLAGVGKDPVQPDKPQPAVPAKKVGVPRPHHLPGRRQAAEDAKTASEDGLQHDPGAVSPSGGAWRPIIPWWRRTTPATAPPWLRKSASAPSRAVASSGVSLPLALSRLTGPDGFRRRLERAVVLDRALEDRLRPVARVRGGGTIPAATATGEPVGEPMESRIERLCVERGLKMTGQRRVIARVLSEASDHPDVEELYRRAAALDPRISVATVYRTVRLLEEKGILERRDFGGGRARYEASEHGHTITI